MEYELQRMINDQKASINQIPNKMAVEIKCTQIEDQIVLVNGKAVVKDMEGAWKSEDQLSMIEAKFFREFIETLERCNNARPLQATYLV